MDQSAWRWADLAIVWADGDGEGVVVVVEVLGGVKPRVGGGVNEGGPDGGLQDIVACGVDFEGEAGAVGGAAVNESGWGDFGTAGAVQQSEACGAGHVAAEDVLIGAVIGTMQVGVVDRDTDAAVGRGVEHGLGDLNREGVGLRGVAGRRGGGGLDDRGARALGDIDQDIWAGQGDGRPERAHLKRFDALEVVGWSGAGGRHGGINALTGARQAGRFERGCQGLWKWRIGCLGKGDERGWPACLIFPEA